MLPVTIGAWFAFAGVLIAIVRAKRIPAAAVPHSLARFDALAVVLVAATIAVSYGWLARSYFLADDFILLVQAHAPLSWRGVFATRGGDGSFRPLGYLSYAISAQWAGSDPAIWHWIGFFLHIANAILLYLLAAAAGYSRLLAWLAASLFAVHGAHPEAAVWMAGRFDLLSAFFVLAGLFAFQRSLSPGTKRQMWLAAALAAMTAGLLSKESAYSFVLVAAWLLACTGAWRSRRDWISILLFGTVTALLFGYRWHLLEGIGGYGPITLIPSLKGLAFRMWGILFFPVNWTLPPGVWLWALAIAYCTVLVRMFLARAELGRIAFAIGFVILTAMPAVSQLLIGADLEKSRVLYLPSAGFCLLLAALARPLQFRIQILAAAALLAFHTAVLEHNLRGWQRASETVHAACVDAAKCAIRTGARPLVTGLPRTLNGVYTFANGFSECVEMEAAGSVPTNADSRACNFLWDAESASLKTTK